jgi:hypothetical protein
MEKNAGSYAANADPKGNGKAPRRGRSSIAGTIEGLPHALSISARGKVGFRQLGYLMEGGRV